MNAAALKNMGIVCGLMFTTATFGDQHLDRLGLPPIAAPIDNPLTPAKTELGKKLFFDKSLSADGSVSCASCHQPERAFSDGLRKSKGLSDQTGTRNAPSLLNASFMESQFWDGRRSSLESQALDPFVNPREHGLTSVGQLLQAIRSNRDYANLFQDAFDVHIDSIDERHVAKAIASYERTIARGNSAFDRYYYAGEKTALSPSARRGLALFTGRAQCVTCHHIGSAGSSFTDHQFHNLHIGLDRIENRLANVSRAAVAARREERSIDATALSEEDISELGRFFITLNPADIGTFRTPSLRNVALTAPYMHDGSVATLEQAVDQEIYYRTVLNGRPLILTPDEKLDLAEFLRNLTSSNVQAVAPLEGHQAISGDVSDQGFLPGSH